MLMKIKISKSRTGDPQLVSQDKVSLDAEGSGFCSSAPVTHGPL